MVVYSDANFVNHEAKSTIETVVMYSQMPIVWSSKTQSVFAPDNCFAELFAINCSLNRALAVRNLMIELKLLPTDKLAILMLSQHC